MFNVGTGELILILVLALIVLGPDKLPSAARQAGRYLAEFRRISGGFQNEFRKAVDSAMDESSEGFDLPDLSDIGFGSSSFKLPDRFDRDVQEAPALPAKPAVNLEKASGNLEKASGSPVADEPAPPTGHVAVDGPPSSFS